MVYIEELLSKLKKLEPIDTGVKSHYFKDKDIRAVVFDIYGTLLVSSSGDIDQADISIENLKKAFNVGNVDLIEDKIEILEVILSDFTATIELFHSKAKNNNIPYPEVDILKVWEHVLHNAQSNKFIRLGSSANIMRMTCIFEYLSNKVFPMPAMEQTISGLSEMGFPLGIVSNAQFYTPVAMNYFLHRTVDLSERIKPFDPDLTIYSYRLGRGKPDTYLYEQLIPVLERKYNFEPEHVLFVGNDMLKDIYPANKVGFKTGLFAGDKRSLRMRSDDERTKDLNSDFVITELDQILKIIEK